MEHSTITVREVDSTETDDRPSFESTQSTPDLSKTSSTDTRHSCEAPLPASPFCSIHSRYEPSMFSPTSPEHTNNTTVDSDAPPPYQEKTTEEQQNPEEDKQMRKRKYSIELSRMMGKQLVKGLNGKEREAMKISAGLE